MPRQDAGRMAEAARYWPGANVRREDAAAWIRQRIPPAPPDEPDATQDGRRLLGQCASCGRAVYGTSLQAACREFGCLWHTGCAENYPFPGRTAY